MRQLTISLVGVVQRYLIRLALPSSAVLLLLLACTEALPAADKGGAGSVKTEPEKDKSSAVVIKTATPYGGSINIIQARVVGTARGPNFHVDAAYTLLNRGKDQQVISIGSAYAEASRYTVKPRERIDAKISYSVPLSGHLTRSLRIDPSVFINDQIYWRPIPAYRVEMTLPSAAGRLVTSTPPATSTRADGNSAIYAWQHSNDFLRAHTVGWTEQDALVNISKRLVQERPDGLVQVEITVSNRSPHALKDLEIEEYFVIGTVEPIAPKGAFARTSHPYSDPRLMWSERIKNLAPGARYTSSYTVKVLRRPLRFHPTRAYLNKALIAASPMIRLPASALPPVRPDQFIVVPTGFDFNYTNEDHHLDQQGVRVRDVAYDDVAKRINWRTWVTFRDKNADDNYRWNISHGILRLRDAFTHSGNSGWLASAGGKSLHFGNFFGDEIKGYDSATVVLKGWHFDFTSDDHHINVSSIRIGDVQYNSDLGTLTWKTEGEFTDKNGDDNYRWQYDYQIIAIRNGAIRYVSSHGSDGGRDALHQGSITDEALRNFVKAAVLPQGWRLNYAEDDHHINEMTFRIANVQYVKTEGKVSWNANFNYSDKNFDDNYTWTYDVVVLVFRNGDYAVKDSQISTDSGGADERSFNYSVDDIFAPVTWTNAQQDGTETGVDCGGQSPAQCISCVQDAIDPGTTLSAPLYSLGSAVVVAAARTALVEYAAAHGKDPLTHYQTNRQEEYVKAIAWFVDEHMDWIKDEDGENAQSAQRTVNSTASRGCGKDFCGDCEDFSILRAALLRSLGVQQQCIFSAIHDTDMPQGARRECPTKTDDDGSGGHVFNLVYHAGKWRIMDYGESLYTSYNNCLEYHSVNTIWNDHYNLYTDNERKSPINGQLLMNYPLNSVCPSANWNWRTYYDDICP